jgi:hypothetical protein
VKARLVDHIADTTERPFFRLIETIAPQGGGVVEADDCLKSATIDRSDGMSPIVPRHRFTSIDVVMRAAAGVLIPRSAIRGPPFGDPGSSAFTDMVKACLGSPARTR